MGQLSIGELTELLDQDILDQYQWPDLLTTLKYVHATSGADIALLQQGQHTMQQRLAFEELLAHQLIWFVFVSA